MQVIASAGRDDLAIVYIVRTGRGGLVECAEALQPPLRREEKWVLLVSTLCGCPVRCSMCDAGGGYEGRLTVEEILGQIDLLVERRFPDRSIPSRKFKIQFARMGEPALNPAVLEVLEELPGRYRAPGLMACLSTVAPCGSERFFEELAEIKDRRYPSGRFQLQFSIHTTDRELRDRLVPVKKWDFPRIARYGEAFKGKDDRKIALNFALAEGAALDARVLLSHFDPEVFLVKITPLNPTYAALANGLSSRLDPGTPESAESLRRDLASAGYDVIVSMGEAEENLIGSNCGQYLRSHLGSPFSLGEGYGYPIRMDPAETLRRGPGRARPRALFDRELLRSFLDRERG